MPVFQTETTLLQANHDDCNYDREAISINAHSKSRYNHGGQTFRVSMHIYAFKTSICLLLLKLDALRQCFFVFPAVSAYLLQLSLYRHGGNEGGWASLAFL